MLGEKRNTVDPVGKAHRDLTNRGRAVDSLYVGKIAVCPFKQLCRLDKAVHYVFILRRRDNAAGFIGDGRGALDPCRVGAEHYGDIIKPVVLCRGDHTEARLVRRSADHTRRHRQVIIRRDAGADKIIPCAERACARHIRRVYGYPYASEQLGKKLLCRRQLCKDQKVICRCHHLAVMKPGGVCVYGVLHPELIRTTVHLPDKFRNASRNRLRNDKRGIVRPGKYRRPDKITEFQLFSDHYRNMIALGGTYRGG